MHASSIRVFKPLCNTTSRSVLSVSDKIHTTSKRTNVATMNIKNVPKPDNSSLPLPPGNKNDLFDFGEEQYQNPLASIHVNVPYLYSTNKIREHVTRRVEGTNNVILQSLRNGMAEAAAKNERFFLVNLPPTPNVSDQPNQLYANDPASIFLPDPIEPFKTKSGAYTLTALTTFRDREIVDLELQTSLYSGVFGKSKEPNQKQANAIAQQAAERIVLLIRQRVSNPALYEAFGLPQNHSSEQSMYELHCWMYMRTIQTRPTIFGRYLNEWIYTYLDQILREELKAKKVRSKRIDQLMLHTLPGARANMIILDKAIQCLVGGDADPLYGALYRHFFRFSEESKFDKPLGLVNAVLSKIPYVTSMDVYMDNPVDFAYMNNLVQYICNQLYSNVTAEPKYYFTHMLGLTDMIDIPKPPTNTLGPLTKNEMERYCYPIYNYKEKPGKVSQFFSSLNPFAKSEQPSNEKPLFVQPIDVAYRPPSFTYSKIQQAKGQHPLK